MVVSCSGIEQQCHDLYSSQRVGRMGSDVCVIQLYSLVGAVKETNYQDIICGQVGAPQ